MAPEFIKVNEGMKSTGERVKKCEYSSPNFHLSQEENRGHIMTLSWRMAHKNWLQLRHLCDGRFAHICNYQWVSLTVLMFVMALHQVALADFRTGDVAYRKGDYLEAYYQWLPLANQGHAPSQLNLGLLLVSQRVEVADDMGAVAWFERAAKQNYAPAYYNLGILYRDGREVKTNKKRAIELFRTAADLGNSFGEFALGLAYLNGDGVEPDKDEGLTWLRLAAEHGNSLAMYELGQLYELGRMVEKDIGLAMSLYRVAAKSEHAAASYRLGMIYVTGSDVNRDIILGLVWLSLAEEYGHEMAMKEATSLRVQMSEEQLRDVESLRSSLLEGPPDLIPVTHEYFQEKD